MCILVVQVEQPLPDALDGSTIGVRHSFANAGLGRGSLRVDGAWACIPAGNLVMLQAHLLKNWLYRLLLRDDNQACAHCSALTGSLL
jgi:hypothetical protein